ncbi:bifunctional adenosylcobinamide kinase/adenosylcobinamide-phosphate guanylyltransferase [Haloechinothrix sp. LS1_15]|uniref:bifunctional adenosylcobinamide kinase/adenosylcobinamide-phosphate guanylyltransferase n=1 Tax=Haloechinothrix sp. LS1_15 TaxID=2652248 RepID=UPI00294B961F|nr:bifunctional adenosylcobinamide kinase/adenosylcobinamide-phosphate guanylyltransferase [Haloechinothrix sp. LS1_15]
MPYSPARRFLAGVASRLSHRLAMLATTARPPATVLVLGGARSGKSQHAERLLAGYREVVYIATGHAPDGQDSEWAERVRRHRARRPPHWHTVETADLPAALRRAQAPVLVDCLATWLARELDGAGAWDGADRWEEHVTSRMDELIGVWRSLPVPAVAVSNEVGSGVVPATPAGRLFRDVLGSLNSRVSAASDVVHLVVAGRAIALPEPPGPPRNNQE